MDLADRNELAARLANVLREAMPEYRRHENGQARWQPRQTSVTEPWLGQLKAYQFEGDDAGATKAKFDLWAAELDESPLSVADQVRRWGRVGGGRSWCEESVQKVISAARLCSSGKFPTLQTPWNSTYTKVACVAAHRRPVPQAIWDSRVAVAVARLLSASNSVPPSDLAAAQRLLRLPAGRAAGTRTAEAMATIHQQGWRRAGHWSFSETAWQPLWRSQDFGSRLLHATAQRLTTSRVGGRNWDSFDVGLALFVHGY